MYKWFFIVYIVLTTLLRSKTYAADMSYYTQYQKTYLELAREYEKLHRECSEIKEEAVCRESEVFARNLIAKKVQAFGEYFELVSSNFLTTFPSIQEEELFSNIEDVRLQTTALKFSAVSFGADELNTLETTANSALLTHANLTTFLSVNYHYYRLQRLFMVLTSTSDKIKSEIDMAKKAGLNTVLAEKELQASSAKLLEIKDKLQSTAKLYEQEQTPQTTLQVRQGILELYQLFTEANSAMLNSANILLRLAESASWESN